jgi:hypothetical protein
VSRSAGYVRPKMLPANVPGSIASEGVANGQRGLPSLVFQFVINTLLG